MCGICGIYRPKGVHSSELMPMLVNITHRGPDDEGLFVEGAIGLGNRRLSIIDLPGGQQPICNEDRSVWTVYNGEIYNYRALRAELEQQGHFFRTKSDTEVIVHLYEELGERFVERLNGMFALALWDSRRQKLVLARDRIGQKPLFYEQEGETFLFASEIKAILAVSSRQTELDYESLNDYLFLRFVPPPRTMLRHIHKLPPAHLLVYQHGLVTISRYWDLSFNRKLPLSENELLEVLREQLRSTVQSHMVGDVPIGAFLSGGLDSSLLVALMARDLGRSVKTFAVGVREQDFNELPFARRVADHHHTHHFEERVEANLIRSLPRMIWHLDEPSDPIAACQFHAASLAARHVKVVVGGDGGDELFAGFDRYLGVGYLEHYASMPTLLRERVIGSILGRATDSFAYKSHVQKLRWVNHLSSMSSLGERYAGATSFFRFSNEEKRQLYGEQLWDLVGHIDSSTAITGPFHRVDAEEPLDRMLYADLQTRLPEHSLMLTDRLTMAHGLEARSPYLDHELVELLAAFPTRMKIRGRTLKYAQRQIAAAYLPSDIVRRPKQGFMFPVAYWFRDSLYPFIRNFLLDSSLVRNRLFRQERVEELLEEHRHSRVDHHVRLWMLLNVELWYQLYIEGKSIACLEERIGGYL